MKSKMGLATLGLLLITVLSSLQYWFLSFGSISISALAFICLTNLIGFVILAAVQFKKFKLFNRRLILKGLILGVELIGYNMFWLLGTQNLDSVVSSSVLSMYFMFVTPMLLLLKKKVSFRSAIASAVAVIALLLMLDADTDAIFKSANIWYAIAADFFFAAYVITVYIVGEEEDPAALTLSQMISSVSLAGIGWIFNVIRGTDSFQLPKSGSIWICILFSAIFIRTIYALVQITCQKYIPPITASLIYSSEVIIALIANPFISRFLNTDYTSASIYQMIGCGFFVIAILLVDDTIMSRFGYNDMEEKYYQDETGKHTLISVSKKLVNMTLGITITALLISTIICVTSIQSVRHTALENSQDLGKTASDNSEKALKKQLETEMQNAAKGKASIIETKMNAYEQAVEYAANYAETLLNNPDEFGRNEISYPQEQFIDQWSMQRCLSDRSVSYASVQEENKLLGNLESVFEAIASEQKYISTIYVGTSDGLLLSYDKNAGEREVGRENYYNFKESTWYKTALNKKEAFFTDAYPDYYGRGMTLTCAAPIIDQNGNFRGAVCIDILIKDMNMSIVNAGVEEPNRSVLLSGEGEVISSKDLSSEETASVSIYQYKFSGIESVLKKAAKKVLSKEDGITSVGKGKDAIYVSYAYIKNTDWVMCVISPVSTIIAPAVEIGKEIDDNTEVVEALVVKDIKRTVKNCLVLFAFIILVATAIIGHLANRISQPLVQLEKDVLSISQGDLQLRTTVSTNDEIGSLARAFNFMTESLQKYILDLKDATAREERIASELSVATKIQADMLPTEFPDIGLFSLYASMTPAKEVGGDFYDFFWVDEDHFAMTIADVSGKGVPAALFMVRAKTLLKDEILQGCQPAEAMYLANNELCENNDESLFVTVWLSIMDVRTGKIVAANAGHEYPTIRKPDGKFEILKDHHSMPLGGLEGVHFKEYELQIDPGSSLYLYTDGVAEATNEQEEMFGLTRTLDALNENPDAQPEVLLATVMERIHDFVKEAPQFDDITMLSMKYYGREE